MSDSKLGVKLYKGHFTNPEYADCAVWCNENGGMIEDRGDYYEVVMQPPYVPTPEEVKQNLINAVQRYMDDTAKERGYDGILSACSYVETGVEQFDNEGAAARTWRSACWAKCYQLLGLYEAGKINVPTEEELIAELPAINW